MDDSLKEMYIQKARDMYADPSDDDIEIDDEPKVSESDVGCWVQAWVHVRKDEILEEET
jgi:hypothetical protein